jgi:zinc/manganese transport system permease protein
MMAPPLVACMILSILYTYFGVHVLKREIIFVDLSMAQLAALGTTVGFAFGIEGRFSSLGFSLGFILLGAGFFTWTRSLKLRVPQEAIIGIVYVVGASVGLIFASFSAHGAEHIRNLLNGSILWIRWEDIVSLVTVGVLIGGIHFLSKDRFQALSESYQNFPADEPGQAGWEFLFYSALGLVIVFSVEKAGIFLVFSYLIIPAVCAALFSANMKIQFFMGTSIALTMSVIGLTLSYLLDLPTGATLVCSFGVVFLGSLIVSRFAKTF